MNTSRQQSWSITSLVELIGPDGIFVDGDWIESKDQDPKGSIRLLQLADIGVGQFLDRSNRWINDDTARRLRCTFVQPGDVLVARMPAPLGRACILPPLPYRCIAAVDVTILRPSEQINTRWLVEAINSDAFHGQVMVRVGGTTRTRISRRNLGSISLVVPPSEVQEAIARLAERFAKLRDGLDAQIAAMRTLKNGLARQLLSGRRRFPHCSQEWSFLPLGDLVESVTRKNVQDNVKRVLTCSGELGLIDQIDYFSKTVASAAREDYILLKKGEFAYNRSAMKGYPFGAIKRLVHYDEGAISTLNICFALRNNSWTPDFAEQLFESGVLNHQLGRITRVGSRAHGLLNVTKSDLFAVRVPVPSIAEQQRIAVVLTSLDRTIRLLSQQREGYEAQKRSTVHQLLSRAIDDLHIA